MNAVVKIILTAMIACIVIIVLNQDKIGKPILSDQHRVYVETIKDWLGKRVVDVDNYDTVYVSRPLDQATVGGNVVMIYKGVRYEFLVISKKHNAERHDD
jgi:hypothetical protein